MNTFNADRESEGAGVFPFAIPFAGTLGVLVNPFSCIVPITLVLTLTLAALAVARADDTDTDADELCDGGDRCKRGSVGGRPGEVRVGYAMAGWGWGFGRGCGRSCDVPGVLVLSARVRDEDGVTTVIVVDVVVLRVGRRWDV
jgi:hypothetical protein